MPSGSNFPRASVHRVCSIPSVIIGPMHFCRHLAEQEHNAEWRKRWFQSYGEATWSGAQECPSGDVFTLMADNRYFRLLSNYLPSVQRALKSHNRTIHTSGCMGAAWGCMGPPQAVSTMYEAYIPLRKSVHAVSSHAFIAIREACCALWRNPPTVVRFANFP